MTKSGHLSSADIRRSHVANLRSGVMCGFRSPSAHSHVRRNLSIGFGQPVFCFLKRDATRSQGCRTACVNPRLSSQWKSDRDVVPCHLFQMIALALRDTADALLLCIRHELAPIRTGELYSRRIRTDTSVRLGGATKFCFGSNADINCLRESWLWANSEPWLLSNNSGASPARRGVCGGRCNDWIYTAEITGSRSRLYCQILSKADGSREWDSRRHRTGWIRVCCWTACRLLGSNSA